jgi:hypothetical protein
MCEMWSLAVREKHTLRVCEDRVLWGLWWKLHNDDLRKLYSSSVFIRVIKSRMIWVGHYHTHREIRNAYEVLVWKPEGKRELTRPRHRGDGNNNNNNNNNNNKPVPMAAQSKARTVFNRSNTGIMGSDPARDMNVCPRFSVLYCPV